MKGTTVTIIIGMGSYETEPATTQAPEETTQSEIPEIREPDSNP